MTPSGKHIIIFISLATLLSLSVLNKRGIGQTKNTVDKTVLNAKIETLISEFEKYAGLTENGEVINKSYKDRLLNLFVTNAFLFNDLDMEKASPRAISISQYIDNLENWYSNGLQVKTMIRKIGNPFEFNNRFYHINVKVRKEIFGLFKDKWVNRKTTLCLFQLQFEFRNGGIYNLKVISIEKISDSRLKLSANLTPSYTQFLINESLDLSDYSGWGNSNGFGLMSDIKLSYKVNSILDIGTGIGTSNYHSTFLLNNLVQHDYFTTDIDQENYYLWMRGENIKETINSLFIKLPVFVRFTPVLPNLKQIFFLETGVEFLIPAVSNSSFKGNATHEGYYPQYHVLLYDIPELGFYTDKPIDHTSTEHSFTTSLNGYIMVGAEFVVFNPKTSLSVGIVWTRGLTAANNAMGSYIFSKGHDDYNSLINASPDVRLQSLGLSVGLSVGLD